MYRRIFKRIWEFLFALIGLIVISPVFILILLFLAIATGGRPLFFQVRPGKNGKFFKVIKFKTMNNKRGPDGKLLRDKDRLTTAGKFIRSTSLDELPQLINVITGDMNLIGPRPLLPEYLSLYSQEQARRHNMRPGITGWAQVNGRNTVGWEQKFKLDVWYVDNVSLKLDLLIIGLTVKKVLFKEGISSGTSVTMERFKGNL